MDEATAAELAAIVATALAVLGALPQLRRVVVRRDGRGVSLAGPLVGAVTELTWLAYAVDAGLWSAAPEAALMATADVTLALALVRTGAAGTRGAGGRAAAAALTWLAVLVAIAVVGGAGALAFTLGAAYAVQLAPALWTAWRTPSPTGIAGSTWAIVAVEAALWGVYGTHHGDPATLTFAVVGTVGAAAMLAARTRVRRPAAAVTAVAGAG